MIMVYICPLARSIILPFWCGQDNFFLGGNPKDKLFFNVGNIWMALNRKLRHSYLSMEMHSIIFLCIPCSAGSYGEVYRADWNSTVSIFLASWHFFMCVVVLPEL